MKRIIRKFLLSLGDFFIFYPCIRYLCWINEVKSFKIKKLRIFYVSSNPKNGKGFEFYNDLIANREEFAMERAYWEHKLAGIIIIPDEMKYPWGYFLRRYIIVKNSYTDHPYVIIALLIMWYGRARGMTEMMALLLKFNSILPEKDMVFLKDYCLKNWEPKYTNKKLMDRLKEIGG